MAIPGGSAFGYSRDIAEGYQVVTSDRSRPDAPEMNSSLRDRARATRHPRRTAAQDDLQEIQAKNRKIQRLNGALMMMRTYRQKVKV
jgi:hypothetical protein